MIDLRVIAARLRALFSRPRLDDDLEEELRSHLALAAEAAERQGMDSGQARREALRNFGGVQQTRELYREQRGLPMIETILKDIRFGLRMLAKSPGFTAVAVLSLALGIGANTAIFTLIDAVLLKTLPVRNPRELVLLEWSSASSYPIGARWINGDTWEDRDRNLSTSFSHPAFQKMRAAHNALSDVFAFSNAGNLNILADGEGGNGFLQMVSGGYFSALGVQASIGRTLVESDDQPGAPPVCVISDRYWQRRFGSNPAITGKTIAIDGAPFTIVGVTRPEFFGLQPGLAIDVSVPLSMVRSVAPQWAPGVSLLNAPDHWWVRVMGRLNSGLSASEAAAALNLMFQQTIVPGPPAFSGARPTAARLSLTPGGQGIDQLRRRYSRPLWILMAMVGLVLLIACVNVANLQLARTTSRRKEMGVRLSLGAPRGRVIRQLLTESILLASMGGVMGLALAIWGSRLLVTLVSNSLTITPDLRVFGFTAATCVLTGIFFGLAPAFRATQVDLTPALKREGPQFLARTLMVAQAAFSLVLLFGSGLFVRTLINLHTIDIGFDQRNVLVFGINAARAGYRGAALNDFYGRVQQRIARLPGVVSASASVHLLLSGSYRDNGLYVPGYTPRPNEKMHVRVVPAGPDFFATMRLPLLLGRDFSERDNDNAPKVAVVNEAFARHYFPNQDPLGRPIAWEVNGPEMEIVGVAKDAKYYSLRSDVPAIVYHPYRQASNSSWMHYEMRTASDPHALIPAVRRELASIDRTVPLFDVKTQTEQVDALLSQERLFAQLSSFFGLLALALACVGLYGISSYGVETRTGELGIRMALGAQRHNIVRMILRDTLLLAIAGLAIGVPASLAFGRLASSLIADLLYGLKSTDVISLALAATALLTVAAVAGVVPARRAARIDPMSAVRRE